MAMLITSSTPYNNNVVKIPTQNENTEISRKEVLVFSFTKAVLSGFCLSTLQHASECSYWGDFCYKLCSVRGLAY